MDSEFKCGWYLNSKETQERLFELGYEWFVGGKEVGYSDKKYIITYENGRLAWGRDEHVSGRPKGTQLDGVKELVTKEELVSALKTIRKLGDCKYIRNLFIADGVLHYSESSSLDSYKIIYGSSIHDEDTGLNELLSKVNQDYNKKKELGESLEKLLSEAENIKKQIEEL